MPPLPTRPCFNHSLTCLFMFCTCVILQTPQYVLLKKIGELFPGPSKTTRAYLHPEDEVRGALREVRNEHE